MHKLSAGKASIFVLAAVFAVSAFLLGKSLTSVFATATNEDNITLCHRTDSVSNPYDTDTVDTNSTDAHGHGDHTGSVATSEAVAQAIKDSHNKWGDIVPPYDYDFFKGQTHYVGHFAGLNWNTDGQAMWNNDCNFVTEVVDVCSNIPGNQATVPDGDYQSGGECFPKTHVCTDPLATNQDKNFNDVTEVSDPGVCTYEGDICPNLEGTQTSLPDGYHFETIGDTRTCVPDPTPTPTLTTNGGGNGGGGGGDGLGCATHDCSGNKIPTPQVLGASTMAKTGSFAQDLFMAIMGVGGTLASTGFVLLKKATKLA